LRRDQMKKTLTIFVCLLISLVSLFSQATNEQPTVKYAFWGNPEAIGVEKDIITAFEAKYPEIKIEPVVSSYGDYHAKLITMIAGGMAPDVMRIDSYYFQDFTKLNAVENLDKFIARDNFSMDIYQPQGIKECSVGNSIYGLPWATAPLYLLLNLDVFEKLNIPLPKLDWTMDDFVRIVKKIKDSSNETYGYATTFNNLDVFFPFIWAYGGDLLNPEKTEFSLNDPKGYKAFEVFSELYQSGYMPKDSITATPDILRRWFVNGSIAMMMGSASQILSLQNVGDIRFEAWPAPHGVNENTTVYTSNEISLSVSSKNKDAAWTFMKFLRGPEGEELYLKAKRMPPTLSDPDLWSLYLDAEKYPKLIKENSLLISQKYGHGLPLRAGYTEVEAKIMPLVQDIVLGHVSAEKAMHEVAPQISDILARTGESL
ncbi:MAG: sugar ABC transporter substrate-binding protein, partial [Lachnospiraceae bacterium]|nr:sugar ABC transporter substrate-binding protein [Lachnospiraceae bacterium]